MRGERHAVGVGHRRPHPAVPLVPRRVGALRRIAPPQPQGDALAIVYRRHPDALDHRREPPRLDDDLPDERNVLLLDGGPRAVGRTRRERRRRPHRAHDLADLRIPLGRERTDVLREVPELLLGDHALPHRIGERRHRRPRQPRLEARVDLLDARPAVEPPRAGEVGGADRLVPIVGQRRRRHPVAAPRRPVALEALQRLVDLAPRGDRLVPAAGGPNLERRRARVGEEGGEGLEVADEIIALALGELLAPPRHRRPRHPLVDDPLDVGIGGELGARTDLVRPPREIARAREHVCGRRPIAGAGVAVTPGAPLVVRRLPRVRLLRRDLAAAEREHRRDADEDDPHDGGAGKQPGCARRLTHGASPPRPHASPTAAASAPTGRRGT